MPYTSIADLPAAQTKDFSEHEKHIFRAAFNAAYAEHQDEGKAFAIAHAAVDKVRAGKSTGALGRLLKALSELLGEAGQDGPLQRSAAPAAATALERITRTVPIAKLDEARRLIYGVVYEPNVPDAHDDMMSAPEIEKMAHGFMRKYATLQAASGLEHAVDVGRDQVVVVESFVAPVEYRLGKQTVPPGSWVMVTKALDEQIWQDVKAGVYTGYSFEGWGRRVPAAA